MAGPNGGVDFWICLPCLFALLDMLRLVCALRQRQLQTRALGFWSLHRAARKGNTRNTNSYPPVLCHGHGLFTAARKGPSLWPRTHGYRTRTSSVSSVNTRASSGGAAPRRLSRRVARTRCRRNREGAPCRLRLL